MSDLDPIDWLELARRLSDTRRRMYHDEGSDLRGFEFDAEALRRTLGYQPADSSSRPHITYETVLFPGLITTAEHAHLRNAHTVLDRLAAEPARKEAGEARDEARRVLRDSARDLAKWLREWCNERRVPSRYRRDGVLLAADWIDPDSGVNP